LRKKEKAGKAKRWAAIKNCLRRKSGLIENRFQKKKWGRNQVCPHDAIISRQKGKKRGGEGKVPGS